MTDCNGGRNPTTVLRPRWVGWSGLWRFTGRWLFTLKPGRGYAVAKSFWISLASRKAYRREEILFNQLGSPFHLSGIGYPVGCWCLQRANYLSLMCSRKVQVLHENKKNLSAQSVLSQVISMCWFKLVLKLALHIYFKCWQPIDDETSYKQLWSGFVIAMESWTHIVTLGQYFLATTDHHRCISRLKRQYI